MGTSDVAVSVIVPVFNTEEYLPECLDSILAQRLTEFEVLCVDDGSTDRSMNILEEYAGRDPRVKIVPQRPGGKGPGIARNTALEQARGEYVAFVDSDDVIDRDILYRLHGIATQHDADITMCTISKFSVSSGRERFEDCSFHSLIPTRLDQQTFTWRDIETVLFGLRFVAWNKIYKRDFLDKWEVRFAEGIFFEDLIFSFQAVLHAEKIRFLRKPLYHNRKERDGATTFVQGARVFDALTAMAQLDELLQSDPEYHRLHPRFRAFRFKKLYGYLYKNDSEHLPPFYERLKEYADDPALDGNPHLRESDDQKRKLIQKKNLLDFLAYELWLARNKNLSLMRQRRHLLRQTRLLRPVSGVKRRLRRLLGRLKPQ